MAALSLMNVVASIRIKTIQRLTWLSPLAVCGTVLFALGSLVQGCESWADRSGKALFNDVVLAPMPESVGILHSQDEPSLLDPWVWLHFSVTPESLAEIEAAYDWTPTSDFELDENDALAGEWWQVDQLEGGRGYEVFVEEKCRCLKEMWVDSEGQEVYFKVSF
ncbi:MAG: hypothetical protein AAFQ63_03040 [Cyanobacteria bacterium J06621_11]